MDKPSFINLTKNFVSLDKPPYNMQSAINYLNFINNITLDNLSSMDSYDYEKIIYFENKYQCNSEIQNLIKNLKIKIAENYETKQKILNKYGR